MTMMNLWHCSYFESYIPYEEHKQTATYFLEETHLSQKLLKAVEKWEEDKKCQGTFIARGPLIDSRAHYIKSVCTVGK